MNALDKHEFDVSDSNCQNMAANGRAAAAL